MQAKPGICGRPIIMKPTIIRIYTQKQWTRRDFLVSTTRNQQPPSVSTVSKHDGHIHRLQIIIQFPRQYPVICSTALIHCRRSYRSNIQNRRERKRMFLRLGRQSRRENRVLFRCITLIPGTPGVDDRSNLEGHLISITKSRIRIRKSSSMDKRRDRGISCLLPNNPGSTRFAFQMICLPLLRKSSTLKLLYHPRLRPGLLY